MRLRMGIATVGYSLLFSLLANSFIGIWSKPILALPVILLSLLINLLAGFFIHKTGFRRRVLCHGTVLMSAFAVSSVLSLVYHLLWLTKVFSLDRKAMIWSILFCLLYLFLLFGNGLLCVFFTSIQLGVSLRVELWQSLIPIFNIPVILGMIFRAYREVILEAEKDALNAARASEKVCATRYPILMVHGVFFRDNKHLNYWGRIPAELIKNGAVVYYGEHQSALSIAESGEELAARIRDIVTKTGCEKVNIIAHSKGGLDCRHALANCGVAPLVASLTTVNTPHRGCLFADWLLQKAPEKLKSKVASIYNSAAKVLGEKKPDFLSAVTDLTAAACKRFNENTPKPEGVYCASIGSVMPKGTSGKFPLNLSYHFVRRFDRENDGLVSLESFAFGDRIDILRPSGDRGISHADMIDLMRENIRGFDVREYYVSLASDLKKRGF